jgi:hypothetical protein
MPERPVKPVFSVPAAPPLARSYHRAARLIWLVCRPALVGGGVWLVLQLPLPLLDDWLPIKNVAAAALAVGSAGACLYNTLFYDHFRP